MIQRGFFKKNNQDAAKCCFQIILFAANHIILQHFAATRSFFKDETCLNQLRMPNYHEIPNLVTMKQDYHCFLRGGADSAPPCGFQVDPDVVAIRVNCLAGVTALIHVQLIYVILL